MKKNAYIKAKKREKFARFAGGFFRLACVFGLCAAIFAGGYTMGNNRGRVAGMIDGAAGLSACVDGGGNGYLIDKSGFCCLYE